MDNQVPPTLEQQPLIPEADPHAAGPERPTKTYSRNWKKWILIYLIIGAIIYAGIYYLVLSKQSSKPNTQPVIKTAASPSFKPTQHHFSDSELGIDFDYSDESKAKVIAFRTGRKICVTPKHFQKTDTDCSGQYVEIFSKQPSQSLKSAIEKQILSDYSTNDCWVTTSIFKALNPNMQYASIQFNIPADNPYANAEKCPYAKAGGLAYFMSDPNFPDKFAFFSIGQYGLPADPAYSHTWNQTFKFTETKKAIDTSDWKTYINSEYKLSFKYPPDYAVNEVKDFPGLYEQSLGQLKVDVTTMHPGSGGGYVLAHGEIWVYKNDSPSLEDWIKKHTGTLQTDGQPQQINKNELYWNITNQKPITIAKQRAVQFDAIRGEGGIYTASLLSKDSYIIGIILDKSEDHKDSAIKTYYPSILSTFKFTQ